MTPNKAVKLAKWVGNKPPDDTCVALDIHVLVPALHSAPPRFGYIKSLPRTEREGGNPWGGNYVWIRCHGPD